MRYDLNILWVEDTATYYEETKEILETYAEDNGISLKFHYIQDVNVFFEKIKKQAASNTANCLSFLHIFCRFQRNFCKFLIGDALELT